MQVMSLAYSRAVVSNEPHRFHLDPVTGKYRLEKPGPEENGKNDFVALGNVPGGEGRLNGHIRVSIEKRIGDPRHEAEPLFRDGPGGAKAGEGDSIMFYPDGTAEAAEIRLVDRGGFELNLKINPVTARVELKQKEGK
jgi:hypothetical protein